MTRILIADDRKSFRTLLSDRLITEGFVVNQATDGLDALEVIANSNYPDLMITDIEMPNLDGYGLINALNLRNCTCPIIVYAVSDFDESRVQYCGEIKYMYKLGSTIKDVVVQVKSILHIR